MARRKGREKAELRGRLRKYRVTIIPTFGPIEIIAENQQDAEDLADHCWDEGWDGEFVTQVEEIK